MNDAAICGSDQRFYAAVEALRQYRGDEYCDRQLAEHAAWRARLNEAFSEMSDNLNRDAMDGNRSALQRRISVIGRVGFGGRSPALSPGGMR